MDFAAIKKGTVENVIYFDDTIGEGHPVFEDLKNMLGLDDLVRVNKEQGVEIGYLYSGGAFSKNPEIEQEEAKKKLEEEIKQLNLKAIEPEVLDAIVSIEDVVVALKALSGLAKQAPQATVIERTVFTPAKKGWFASLLGK